MRRADGWLPVKLNDPSFLPGTLCLLAWGRADGISTSSDPSGVALHTRLAHPLTPNIQHRLPVPVTQPIVRVSDVKSRVSDARGGFNTRTLVFLLGSDLFQEYIDQDEDDREYQLLVRILALPSAAEGK